MNANAKLLRKAAFNKANPIQNPSADRPDEVVGDTPAQSPPEVGVFVVKRGKIEAK